MAPGSKPNILLVMADRILSEFDPETIEHKIVDMITDKRVVHEAMERDGTSWDYAPCSDPAVRYTG